MAERDWTAVDVADHFEEPFRTLRRLPPVKARGHFNAWPTILRDPEEIAAMTPEPMRIVPSARSISGLERTFEWMPWLQEPERRLVWSRAARVPWKVICREMGCDRTTAWRRWLIALTKIASRLNAK